MSTQGYEFQMTGADHTVAADRESIVKEFEWAVTELQKTVEQLAMRLQPVLRPFPLENAIASESQPPVSDARQRLHDLQATTQAIHSLLDRLEV